MGGGVRGGEEKWEGVGEELGGEEDEEGEEEMKEEPCQIIRRKCQTRITGELREDEQHEETLITFKTRQDTLHTAVRGLKPHEVSTNILQYLQTSYNIYKHPTTSYKSTTIPQQIQTSYKPTNICKHPGPSQHS